MNSALRREILNHIFNKFGLFTQYNYNNGLIANLLTDEFLLPRKLMVEVEGHKFENNLFGGDVNLESSKLSLLIADLKEETPEFAIIIKMGEISTFALRLSEENDDFGSFYFRSETKWIEAGTAIQAKLLYGVEGLSQTLLSWGKLVEFKTEYDLLIDFMNFYDG